MFPYTEPTPQETPPPKAEDANPWHFLIGLAVALLTVCGIPTALIIFGAWAPKVIWGL